MIDLDKELEAIKAEKAMYEAEAEAAREDAVVKIQGWFFENLEENEAKLQRKETRETNIRHKAAVKIQNGLYWRRVEKEELQLQYEENLAASVIQRPMLNWLYRARAVNARRKRERQKALNAQRRKTEAMHKYTLKMHLPEPKAPEPLFKVKESSPHLVKERTKMSDQQIWALKLERQKEETKKQAKYKLDPELRKQRRDLADKAHHRQLGLHLVEKKEYTEEEAILIELETGTDPREVIDSSPRRPKNAHTAPLSVSPSKGAESSLSPRPRGRGVVAGQVQQKVNGLRIVDEKPGGKPRPPPLTPRQKAEHEAWALAARLQKEKEEKKRLRKEAQERRRAQVKEDLEKKNALQNAKQKLEDQAEKERLERELIEMIAAGIVPRNLDPEQFLEGFGQGSAFEEGLSYLGQEENQYLHKSQFSTQMHQEEEEREMRNHQILGTRPTSMVYQGYQEQVYHEKMHQGQGQGQGQGHRHGHGNRHQGLQSQAQGMGMGAHQTGVVDANGQPININSNINREPLQNSQFLHDYEQQQKIPMQKSQFLQMEYPHVPPRTDGDAEEEYAISLSEGSGPEQVSTNATVNMTNTSYEQQSQFMRGITESFERQAVCSRLLSHVMSVATSSVIERAVKERLAIEQQQKHQQNQQQQQQQQQPVQLQCEGGEVEIQPGPIENAEYVEYAEGSEDSEGAAVDGLTQAAGGAAGDIWPQNVSAQIPQQPQVQVQSQSQVKSQLHHEGAMSTDPQHLPAQQQQQQQQGNYQNTPQQQQQQQQGNYQNTPQQSIVNSTLKHPHSLQMHNQSQQYPAPSPLQTPAGGAGGAGGVMQGGNVYNAYNNAPNAYGDPNIYMEPHRAAYNKAEQQCHAQQYRQAQVPPQGVQGARYSSSEEEMSHHPHPRNQYQYASSTQVPQIQQQHQHQQQHQLQQQQQLQPQQIRSNHFNHFQQKANETLQSYVHNANQEHLRSAYPPQQDSQRTEQSAFVDYYRFTYGEDLPNKERALAPTNESNATNANSGVDRVEEESASISPAMLTEMALVAAQQAVEGQERRNRVAELAAELSALTGEEISLRGEREGTEERESFNQDNQGQGSPEASISASTTSTRPAGPVVRLYKEELVQQHKIHDQMLRQQKQEEQARRQKKFSKPLPKVVKDKNGRILNNERELMQIAAKKAEQLKTYDPQSGLFGVDEQRARDLKREHYAAERAYKKQREQEDRAHMLENRSIVGNSNNSNSTSAPTVGPPSSLQKSSKSSNRADPARPGKPKAAKSTSSQRPAQSSRRVVGFNPNPVSGGSGPGYGPSGLGRYQGPQEVPGYMKKLASFMAPPDVRNIPPPSVNTDSYIHVPMGNMGNMGNMSNMPVMNMPAMRQNLGLINVLQAPKSNSGSGDFNAISFNAGAGAGSMRAPY